jgi:hypothetical protein
MKKARKYIILAVALLLTVTIHAQVFLMDLEEYELSERVFHNPETPFAPYEGGDFDQTPHVPLGSGWLVLAGLGTAYLIRKHRKNDDE